LVWSLSGDNRPSYNHFSTVGAFSHKFSIAPSAETTNRIKKVRGRKNGTDLLYHHAKYGRDRGSRASCRRTRSSAVAKKPRMLPVCIASIQNVERSLLLLVVSTSDIPLRTINFFSVLFRVFVHAAGRHKQTFAGALPTVRSTVHGRR